MHRTTARAVGVLFIVASAAAVVGGSLLLPIEDRDALTAVGDAEGQMVAGVLLEMVLVLSVVGIAALLVPVLRQPGEGLAMAYLGVRILEGVLLLAASASALVILGLARDGAGASGQATLDAMLAIRHWTYDLGSLLLFGVSALILYSLLLRGALVPAWLSIWGLVGGVLILAEGVLVVAGVKLSDVAVGLMAAPIGLNELVLAIWLIARGFDAPAAVSSADRAPSIVASAGPEVAGGRR